MASLVCVTLVSFYSIQSAKAAPTEESPSEIRLWQGKAPGTESWTGAEVRRDVTLPAIGTFQIVTNVTIPTMTIVRPKLGTANGTAVIVIPGGGFRVLAWDMEGAEIASWLADRGITAFILKYRVRQSEIPPVQPLMNPSDFDSAMQRSESARLIAKQDALQALRIVRSRATEFGVAPDKIGMMGFSAGAITAMGAISSNDPATRPDFAMPIYGAIPNQDLPVILPPLFIIAAQDDKMVPALKSVDIFNKWTLAGGRAELHLYEQGGHGFGMRQRSLPVDKWREALELWLQSHGLIGPKIAVAP